MKVFKLATFIVLFTSLFAGCNNDDIEGFIGTRDYLIGTWSQTHAKGHLVDDGIRINYDTRFDEGVLTMTFYENGTGRVRISHPNLIMRGLGTFTWTFESGIITIVGDYDTIHGRVRRLTSSSLVLDADLQQREQHERMTLIKR